MKQRYVSQGTFIIQFNMAHAHTVSINVLNFYSELSYNK